MSTCRHCQRTIIFDPEYRGWVDPEASGDDLMWRETCDEVLLFSAEHEPEESPGSTIMETRITRLAGNFVAECPACHVVCAYWDEEDLDENGDLRCYCKEEGR